MLTSSQDLIFEDVKNIYRDTMVSGFYHRVQDKVFDQFVEISDFRLEDELISDFGPVEQIDAPKVRGVFGLEGRWPEWKRNRIS